MAGNKKFVTLPINPDGSINVHINKTDGPMDVNIKNVESGAYYYVRPIAVKIDK